MLDNVSAFSVLAGKERLACSCVIPSPRAEALSEWEISPYWKTEPTYLLAMDRGYAGVGVILIKKTKKKKNLNWKIKLEI